jgi:hypothetical protein
MVTYTRIDYTCSHCDICKYDIVRTVAPHQHNYSSTITTPTCTDQGYTTYTCECGDSYVDDYVEATGHAWDDGVVDKEPTETESGSKTLTCTTCKETKTVAIPNKNHVHDYTATVTAPTCTAKGYTTHTCKCGDSYTSSDVKALGHSYGAWTVKTQATCDTDGAETRTCSRCNKVETRSIGAVGHSYGSWSTTKEATCSTNGSQSRTCSKCHKNETKSIAATGHKWDNGKTTVTPTTCGDVGIKTYTCTVCSTTKIERINGAHNYGEWQWEEYEWEETLYDPLGNAYRDPLECRGHRQVRVCKQCSHKDYKTGEKHAHYKYYHPQDYNTGWWLDNQIFKFTTLVESTCQTKKKVQKVCNLCGYTVIDEEDKFGNHVNQSDTKKVSASKCTFAFSVTKKVCKLCGFVDYVAHPDWDERRILGYKKRYSFHEDGPKWADFFTEAGAKSLYEHPYGWVTENPVVDSEGYLVKYTMHAHDPETGECIKRVVTEQEIYDLVINSWYENKYKQKWIEGKAYIYISYALERDEHGNKWLRPYIKQLVA